MEWVVVILTFLVLTAASKTSLLGWITRAVSVLLEVKTSSYSLPNEYQTGVAPTPTSTMVVW